MVGQARAVASLSGRLRDALPAELADALVTANVGDDGRLVVIARTPAWAARLRFEADRLISAAEAAGQPATHCVVRVSHDAPAATGG